MSYTTKRATTKFLSDLNRSINENIIGPPANIYRCDDELKVEINLPGFDTKKDKVEVRLVGEKKDCGPFDVPAHVHVKAKREKLQDILKKDDKESKCDVIAENRPIEYDFTIPLFSSIKEGDEIIDDSQTTYVHGVYSIVIKHKLPGKKAQVKQKS